MSLYKSLVAAFTVSVVTPSVFAANPAPTLAANITTPAVQTTPAAKVNVNTARTKDLLNVKGMNPVLAKAIVSYRKRHGDFKSVEDLAKVRKLSKLNPVELKAIQDQLSL